MKKAMSEKYINKQEGKGNFLENNIDPKILSTLEKWRQEDTKT